MIIYNKVEGKIEKSNFDLSNKFPKNIVWVDLIDISSEEEEKLEEFLNIDIPTPEETKDTFISNRLYEKDDAIYMTISLYLSNDGDIYDLELHTITFILFKDLVITLRDIDLDLFNNIKFNCKHMHDEKTSFSIFLTLLEGIINDTAASLEKIGYALNNLNENILHLSPIKKQRKVNYKTFINDIANIGNSVSKTRESLVTFNRMLTFLSQVDLMDHHETFHAHIKLFLEDINALRDQASFLASKVGFLLDSTLGLINIEQNNIIKIFSVVSVIFTPPTLIAAIYGMNYEHLPEFQWKYGYPWALLLMLISSILPYRYFKKKNWL
ncbi:MAG: corA [Rickettsiaceae bacterium]|jgi:magnesium transporter|nr:corA [Rickettsiaceae bacterium]